MKPAVRDVTHIFIDDGGVLNAVAWAAQAGMQTVHICRQGEHAQAADHVVGRLPELAGLPHEA